MRVNDNIIELHSSKHFIGKLFRPFSVTLAQYYTAAHVSDQLIAQLDAKEASTVLDIGCGESSLLLAAGKRWRDAELIGFDIDPRNTYEPSQSMRLHRGTVWILIYLRELSIPMAKLILLYLILRIYMLIMIDHPKRY